jgi:hypothetical protein
VRANQSKGSILTHVYTHSIDRVRKEVISDDDEVEEVDIRYNGRVVKKVQLSREKVEL